MIRIKGAVVINRPVEEVFDFVADARNEPRYNPRIRRAEKVSDGPIGPGTRFRTETTSMGRTTEMIIEIIEYQRPRRLVSTTRLSAMDIHGTLTFDPVDSGTRMQWSWDVKPRGIYKLMAPLIGRMGQRQEERIWQAMQQFLEAQEKPTGQA